ncbi:pyrophosphohydrolase domain-containing protein [Streptomyces sp. UC1A3]
MTKLVRDKVPEIIRRSGETPDVYVADAQDYRQLLRAKLGEEVGEFLDAGNDEDALEELADVLEVVHALAADLGAGPEQLESLRAAKAAERGGFTGRIVWTGNH